MKKVSVCIVNHNSAQTIFQTVDTLLKQTKGVELKIYITDTASEDGSAEQLAARYPQVELIRLEKNVGFGAGNNAVLGKLDSDYHVLVNPDIELSYDVLTQMSTYLEEHPEVGILSPKILNMDGSVQQLPKKRPHFLYLLSGRLPGLSKYRTDFTMADRIISKPIPVDFCTGCFLMIRTELFCRLGGFDERYFLYLEDADLTREAQKYVQTVYHPDCFVYHHWHRASGKSLKFLFIHIVSMCKYFFKWAGK